MALSFNTNILQNKIMLAKENANDPFASGPIAVKDADSFWVLTQIMHDSENPADKIWDLSISMSIANTSPNKVIVKSVVSGSNTTPKKKEFGLEFICDGPFKLEYINDTAFVYSSSQNLSSKLGEKLNDNIMKDGVMLGFYGFLDGDFPGGKNNMITVSIKVKVVREPGSARNDNNESQITNVNVHSSDRNMNSNTGNMNISNRNMNISNRNMNAGNRNMNAGNRNMNAGNRNADIPKTPNITHFAIFDTYGIGKYFRENDNPFKWNSEISIYLKSNLVKIPSRHLESALASEKIIIAGKPVPLFAVYDENNKAWYEYLTMTHIIVNEQHKVQFYKSNNTVSATASNLLAIYIASLSSVTANPTYSLNSSYVTADEFYSKINQYSEIQKKDIAMQFLRIDKSAKKLGADIESTAQELIQLREKMELDFNSKANNLISDAGKYSDLK